MKTQDEIDVIRGRYKKHWDANIQRLEAKRDLFRSTLDAMNAALLGGAITIMPQPGEAYAGQALESQLADLEEDLAWRAVQWEIIQDEYAANDHVRKSAVNVE